MKTTFVAQALESGRGRKHFLGHEGGGLSFQFLFVDRGRFDAEETFERMGLRDRIPYVCINGCGYEDSLRAIKKAGASIPFSSLMAPTCSWMTTMTDLRWGASQPSCSA